MWPRRQYFIGRIKTNNCSYINKYAVSVIWHFSSLRLFHTFYWQIPHYSSLGYKYAQSCHVAPHSLIKITSIYDIFNFPCSSKDIRFSHYSFHPPTHLSLLHFSSCVTTVFVQIMQRVWQRKACSCPTQ